MEDTVVITAVNGVFVIKDDLKDYVDRGLKLAGTNMLDLKRKHI
jgi:hypothetical protein